MHITAVCMPPSFGFELVNGAISNMEGEKIDDDSLNAHASRKALYNSINDSLFSLESFRSYPNLLASSSRTSPTHAKYTIYSCQRNEAKFLIDD